MEVVGTTTTIRSFICNSSLFPPLFSHHRRPTKLNPIHGPLKRLNLANAESGGPRQSSTATTSGSLGSDSGSSSFSPDESISFVDQDSVPLEGVIQFEKPDSNSFSDKLNKWGWVALLAGGDAAIGRFSHGFSVFDPDTLRTADPFIAGWFLSAYFLGGFGRMVDSLGCYQIMVIRHSSLAIRAASVGHIPPVNFIVVTMGTTAVLLIGWRTLLFSFLPTDKSKKNDVYKSGSPFELL